MNERRPTTFRGPGWELHVVDGGDVLYDGAGTDGGTLAAGELDRVRVGWSWFRWFLYRGDVRLLRLRGLDRAGVAELRRALEVAAVQPLVDHAVRWHEQVTGAFEASRSAQRWLPRETVDTLEDARPARDLVAGLQTLELLPHLPDAQQAAIRFLSADLRPLADEHNDRVMQAELRDRAEFFQSIEKSPLTDEQARAVVCFDNRVQLLAAAGSGKTSVMVARAAYAVARGFVDPDRILLLAFNRDAADELQTRIDARLAAAGIPSAGIRASTFHAFGLHVIAEATGAKPRLARWVEQGRDIDKVLDIVDRLSDRDPSFRRRWDLYRLVYGRAPEDLDDDSTADARHPTTREPAYRTYGGEIVRSHSERMVADWLFFNGVAYEYERDYTVDTRTTRHSQYRPDFYYPDIDVWHEHWGLDRNGNPPPDWTGYRESMRWKKRLHAQHGTTLLETTHAEILDGDGFARLERDLVAHGLELDWNPDRDIVDDWARPVEHEQLARLVRTFMTHVKGGGIDRAALYATVDDGDGSDRSRHRTRTFLDLYWAIHDEWEADLAETKSIDFEDMLVQAADHLAAGRYRSPYELILVDEFQDASRARARLVQQLVADPGRYLLTVGDDWQSINRFAGADLSVMRNFTDLFGDGPQLALTTTFRCTQTICDISRSFVVKNPNQFDKPMRSAHGPGGPPVHVIATEDPTATLVEVLGKLAADHDRDTPLTVDVLGRYNFDRDVLPRGPVPEQVTLTFRTVHRSKGLEADVIVLPKLVTGTYGFPSTITDDPVLHLAMPEPDDFDDAEERRLFYVALTRARRQVVILTHPGRPSPFVRELIADHTDDGLVTADGFDGGPEPCPVCGVGMLVARDGKHGRFLGCSTYPRCDHTRRVDDPASDGPSVTQRRCDICGTGRLVRRSGRYGAFLGCTRYPSCTNTAVLPA